VSTAAWQVIWMVVLGSGLLGMAGLLLAVGTGSVRELRQSLQELRAESEGAPSEKTDGEQETFVG